MATLKLAATQGRLPADASSVRHTPGVAGGDACIRSTRIPVWMLVRVRQLGRTDADLVENFQGLTPADLIAAWEYHRDHPAEIDSAIAAEEAEG